MRTTSTFTVTSFEPVDDTSPVETGVPVGHPHMVKEFTGGRAGRAFTQFSFAFDQGSGVGHDRGTRSDEPDCVHRMRVACRSLRSTLTRIVRC